MNDNVIKFREIYNSRKYMEMLNETGLRNKIRGDRMLLMHRKRVYVFRLLFLVFAIIWS